MDPISLSASIVSLAQLCSAIAAYTLDVKNARKQQWRLQQEFQSTRVVLEQIELSRQRAPESFGSTVEKLSEPNGPLHQLRSLVESIQHKLQSSQRNVLSKLAWPFSQSQYATATDVIHRLKTIFIWAQVNDLTTLNESLVSDVDDLRGQVTSLGQDLSKTQAWVQNVSFQIEDVRQVQQDDLDKEIVDWVCPLDFSRSQAGYEQDRAAEYCVGTCSAAIEHPYLLAWGSSDCRALHFHGAPGSGKSVLLAHLATQMKAQHLSGNVAVASVYLSHKFPKRSLALILSHILQQITRTTAGISKELLEAYTTYTKRGSRLQMEDMRQLYQSQCYTLDHIYVLVDALDESLLVSSSVIEFIRSLGVKFHIMSTSRYPTTALPSFSEAKQVEFSATQDDISRYTHYRLLSDHFQCIKIRTNDELRQQISHAVVARSQGLFLLAKLHMDGIQRKPRERDVQQALLALPQDLNATYSSTLARIDPEYRALANKVFAWTCLTKEPMTTQRLQSALAVLDSQDGTFDEGDFWPLDFLVEICGGLVKIHSDDTVSLVHYTLMDFLVRHLAEAFPDAESYITKTCLRCLTSIEPARSLKALADRYGEIKLAHILQFVAVDSQAQLKRSLDLGFVGYAVRNAVFHAKRRKDMVNSALLLQLFEEPGVFVVFRRLYAYLNSDIPRIHGDFSDSMIDAFEPIHLTVHLGLVDATSYLIDRGHDPGAFAYQRNNRVTPLLLAAYRNDVAIVDCLLKGHALPNIPSSVSLGAHGRQRWKFFQFLTPTGLALLRKSAEALRLLLQCGGSAQGCSSIDLRDVHLQELSRVDEILGCDSSSVAPSASPSREGLSPMKGRSPLPITPDTPFFEKRMAECLAHKAEAPSRASSPGPSASEMVCSVRSRSSLDTYNSLPLFVIDVREEPRHKTAIPGEEPLIITLLKVLRDELVPLVVSALRWGALDAAANDAMRNTALHTLAKRPRIGADGIAALTALLFEQGVDPRASNVRRVTALHIAAMYGNTRVALHLIERGVDVDVLDKRGYGPLHYAAKGGHQEIQWGILRRLCNVSGELFRVGITLHSGEEKTRKGE